MSDASRAKKTVRMRTRKRAGMARSVRYAAMTTGLAAMLATGHAETPEQPARGEISPSSDRALAKCIDEARCAWAELAGFVSDIIEAHGKAHVFDASQHSRATSLIDSLVSKMDELKSTLDVQKASLSFAELEDQRCAAALLKSLEKNIAAAQKRVVKLKKKAAKKRVRARTVARSAVSGEDETGEALGNLVAKTKRMKKARKKAAKRSAPSRHRWEDDFEVKQKSGRKRAEKKAGKKATKKAARKKAAKKVARSRGGPGAKVEKNTYLALAADGKVAESDAFYFETLPFELSGEIVAHADVGLFSSKSKAVAAAGDGEQGCLEVSTVGSAPTEAFVSLCGRQNAGRGGFEAYMLTPQGARSVTFLAGVSVAELRMSIQGGAVTFEVRDADARGTWTTVDSVPKPADPLTFSIGAAFMGTGDEVGFDNLSVAARVED